METISHPLLTFLLNALWQVPLVAAVAALACRMMGNGPASHRHAVWVAALVISLLLPMASLRRGDDSTLLRSAVPPAASALAGASSAASATLAAAGAAPASRSRTISYAPAVGAVLLGAYLLFLLVRLDALLWAWIRTERIREEASSRALPALVERIWRRCLEAFGLRDVELLASATVPSPAAAGAWRKTIILPEALLGETSEDLLTTAIGHEMAHLARRDFAWKVVYEVLYVPISFHPAAALIRRGIEQTREMACDELVTRKLLDAGAYARSIMSIARAMTAVPNPGYTLGVFDGDILEQRIRRLVERPAASLKRARLLLATGMSALALCAAIASGLAISARAQGGAAQDEMKQAESAYNRGDFGGAAAHFRNAVKLDPGNVRPKLFLANALITEHFKGTAIDSQLPEARQQYLDVLAADPQDRQAIEGMATVTMYERQFSEAHDWVMKVIEAQPKDESAYYTAGFLDWSMIYPSYMKARAAAGMKPPDPGIIPDATIRTELRSQIGPQLEEGFRMLQVALSLNPSDSDAMAYINLLYRIQAAIVDTDAESKDAIAKADDWVGQALAMKRQNAQNPHPAPPPLDVEGTPPGPGSAEASHIPAPPPPPPPPPPPANMAIANQPASAAPLAHVNLKEVPGMFWQVVGSGNTAANTLAQSLKAEGFANRLIVAADGQARVMVGPYNDPQSLEQAKAALAAAGVQVVRQW